jgi:protein O-GlcNAc transferase
MYGTLVAVISDRYSWERIKIHCGQEAMSFPNAAKQTEDTYRIMVDIEEILSKAWKLRAEGRLDEAATYCRQILENEANHAQTLHLFGLVRWQQGDPDQAASFLKRAIRVEPDQPRHYNNLGVIYNENKHYRQAAHYLKKALQIFPDYYDAWCNLGLSLFHQAELSHAQSCFESILQTCPAHSEALSNLGMIRLVQGAPAEAAKAYEKAISIDSRKPRWWGNLGSAYMSLGLFSKAVDCFTRALSIDSQNSAHGIGLGVALRALGDWRGTIKILLHVLTVSPDHPEAMANLSIALQHTCQWEPLNSLYRVMDKATQSALDARELPAEQPMLSIRRCSDMVHHHAVARAWSRHAEQMVLRDATPFRHSRLRSTANRITIGYLSYDFRDHVIAHQLLPLYRLHDRSRFRVIAFSMGPNDNSFYRRQIEKNCDDFVDLSTTDTVQAAQIINNCRVDILVDLMGHSHHNRMGILALRPAPVQVGYLGFVASSGADFIDYLIADDVVVPESHAPFYSEKLIRLPHCYQMHPGELMEMDTLPPKRSDWGLPEKDFIFCSFNQPYKIDYHVFSIWTRILGRIPRSVLWLYGENTIAIGNLQNAAEKSGIDKNRLIFADKIPLPRHLARIQLADLALDTLSYNGGATTSNALQAGVPVLTVMGEHWAARMTASHLLAAGLPELVAPNVKAYEQIAVALAGSPEHVHVMRSKLKCNHSTHPLFNTAGFVRHIEKSYEMIFARYAKGQPVRSIRVPSSLSD